MKVGTHLLQPALKRSPTPMSQRHAIQQHLLVDHERIGRLIEHLEIELDITIYPAGPVRLTRVQGDE